MEIDDALAARIMDALAPFSRFGMWVEAVCELDGEPSPKGSAVIASLMGGGGSDYIWMADLRVAREVLIDVQKLLTSRGTLQDSDPQPPTQ